MLHLLQNHKFNCSFISLLVGIVIIINLQNQNLRTKQKKQDSISYEKQQLHLKTSIELQKKMPDFGLNNLIADWNYLQFIQYFGDSEARTVTGYPLVTDYFETIVDRDPRFMSGFMYLSTANSLFAARPEKSIELIEKATETITPDLPGYPFLLWVYKATDEILFLGDLEAAKNSYLMAEQWARARHDEIGNEMAERYHKTANFLANEPDPTQAQFGAWMTALSGIKDLRTQNYIIDRLKELGAKVDISPNGKLDIKPPQFDQA